MCQKSLFIVNVVGILSALFLSFPSYSQEVETIPFQMVEQKPSFNGGDVNDYVRWIKEQITDQSYDGRIALALVVKHDGSVENVRVIRGLDPKLDEQVVRIASSSPKWTPGRQNGKLVNVEYSMLPIAFSSSPSSSASTASSNRGTQGSAQGTTVEKVGSSNRSVNDNTQASLTAVVWATPAGNEVFKLYSDGTADVKMDVSYRTKWEQDDDEFIFIGGTGTVKQWMLDSSTGSVFAVYASSVTQRPVAKLVQK